MPFKLSQMLAAQGAVAPEASTTATPAKTPEASGMTGFTPDRMLALMQAFGGLRAPAQPPVPDVIKPPAPIAPQGANPGAISNTGATAAIASLLAAGLQPGGVPALGQLINAGGR